MKRRKPEQNQEVLIFYSSRTEPELEDFYTEGINYLKDLHIKTKVIDVLKDPETAEKNKILVTPALLIKKGNNIHKYVGIVNGLKQLLFQNLYGKSILQVLDFREGKELGKKMRFVNPKKIEEYLKTMLFAKKVKDFSIVKFDKARNYVKIKLVSEGKKKKGCEAGCFELSAFFSGIFTEIFGTKTYFKETRCTSCGSASCEFVTLDY